MAPLFAMSHIFTFRGINVRQMVGETVQEMGRKCDRWIFKQTDNLTDKMKPWALRLTLAKMPLLVATLFCLQGLPYFSQPYDNLFWV